MSQDCPNVGGDGRSKSGCFKYGEDGHVSQDCKNPDREVGRDGFSDHDTNWTTFLYHLELQQQGRTNSWFMELEKLIFHLKRVKHHPLVKKLAVCQRTQVS
ncbi:uncharacterized protein LOC143249014 isoform X3 [Tachypleus tridentatus]|uniref:uncharacterized protein LOC143249014 isoform X3 n=1 Tax=Tachypleus tridentatus TaxID=6853 RepID=UPI003FCF27B1